MNTPCDGRRSRCPVLFTSFVIAMSALGCGSSDSQTDETPGEGLPSTQDTSCVIRQGLPGSGEFLLVCPDGSQVKIRSSAQGELDVKGEDTFCSVEEPEQGVQRLVCPDGTQLDVVEQEDVSSPGAQLSVEVSTLEPGEDCVRGGQRYQLTWADPETGSKRALDPIDVCRASCDPGARYVERLARCIPYSAVAFDGVIESVEGVEVLPEGFQTPGLTVNSGDVCRAWYAGPTGLVTPTGAEMNAEGQSVEYSFGHVEAYTLALEVGGIRLEHDTQGIRAPDDLMMSRSYTPGFSDMPGVLGVRIQTETVMGFEAFSFVRLRWTGSVLETARGEASLALPGSLQEWTPLMSSSPSPLIRFESYDSERGIGTQLACRLTSVSSVSSP